MKKNATWYLPYTINFLEACTSAMFVHFEPESSGSSKSVHTAHVCFRKKLQSSSIQQGVSILSISSLHFHSRIFQPHNFIPAFSSPEFFIPAYSNLTRAYPMLWVIFFFRIRIYLVFLCTFSLLLCTYLPSIKRKGAFYTIPI